MLFTPHFLLLAIIIYSQSSNLPPQTFRMSFNHVQRFHSTIFNLISENPHPLVPPKKVEQFTKGHCMKNSFLCTKIFDETIYYGKIRNSMKRCNQISNEMNLLFSLIVICHLLPVPNEKYSTRNSLYVLHNKMKILLW